MKIKKMKMGDKFEVYGYFSINDQNFEGIFYSDGLYYNLKFITGETERVIKSKTLEKVEFYTSEGEYLILQSGIQSKSKMNFPGLFEVEYIFSEFWLSIDRAQPPLNFNKAQINFSGLKEYMMYSPFTEESNKEESMYKISVDKKAIKMISNRTEKQLKLNCFIKINRSPTNDMTFHYDNSFKLEYSKPTSFENCIENLIEINHLFSFITNEKHKIYELQLLSFNEEKSRYNRFKVFMRMPFDFKEYHKTVNRFEINNFINDNFDKIYQYFNDNNQVFEDIFSSFIKQLYTTKFVSSYLLELLKLNEGLHRRITKDKKMNLIDRYKEMFNVLDKDLQAYLKKLIVFKESIFKYLKNYRNYYSHYSEINEKPKYPQDNDVRIGEFVLQLQKAYIFNEIGIDSNEIIKLLKVTHMQYENAH